MRQKLLLIVTLTLVLLSASPLAAQTDARQLQAHSFTLQHKSADKAAALIRPLLSAQGTIALQSAGNALVVTDRPENMRRIIAAVEAWDAPSRGLSVRIQLVAAGREAKPKPVPQDLQEIAGKLAGALRFNSFERLGDVTATGNEGSSIVSEIGSGYRAEFEFGEFDSSAEAVTIRGFQLSRVRDGENGGDVVPLLKTSLNLKVGQTVIVGASREAGSSRALMLVLVAQRGN